MASTLPGRHKEVVQEYVKHLEQALRSREQELLEATRETRQLKGQLRRLEGQPPVFGDLFDGKEQLPSKLRVHLLWHSPLRGRGLCLGIFCVMSAYTYS